MPEDLIPQTKKGREYLMYGAIGVAVILVAAYIQRKTNLNGGGVSASNVLPASQTPVIVSGGSDSSGSSDVMGSLNQLQAAMVSANVQNQNNLASVIQQVGQSQTDLVNQLQTQNQNNLTALTQLINSRKRQATPVQVAGGTLTQPTQPTYTAPINTNPVIPNVAPTVQPTAAQSYQAALSNGGISLPTSTSGINSVPAQITTLPASITSQYPAGTKFSNVTVQDSGAFKTYNFTENSGYGNMNTHYVQ